MQVIRRAMFYWQFIAAIALPVWLLLSRGIIRDGLGWDFLLYLILCPVLFIVMLSVALLTSARKRVRTTRELYWPDVTVLLLWHAAILLYSFLGYPALAAAIVVLAIVGFWLALWQLFTETRTRVKNAFSLDPIDAGNYPASTYIPGAAYAPGTADGPVLIVNPDGSREQLPPRG